MATEGSVGGSAGIQGVVLRGGTSDRIGGALVRLGNGRTARATPSGYWRIGKLAPGEHSLTVSSLGYADTTTLGVAESGSYSWASVALFLSEETTPDDSRACEGACGTEKSVFEGRQCYCDSLCEHNNDCCESYWDECK